MRKALKPRPADMAGDKWEDLDEKALSALQLSLFPDVLREVMNAKSAAELWKKLEKLYMTKSLANRPRLRAPLYYSYGRKYIYSVTF